MIIDSFKLALIDSDTNNILKTFSFDNASNFDNIRPSNDGTEYKYIYYMKIGDILYNGEALISESCQY